MQCQLDATKILGLKNWMDESDNKNHRKQRRRTCIEAMKVEFLLDLFSDELVLHTPFPPSSQEHLISCGWLEDSWRQNPELGNWDSFTER